MENGRNNIYIKDEKVQKTTNQNKEITLNGISIGRLFNYFFIYSIIGYLLETVFALLVFGVYESRKSFLYGPFCSIYGVGTVIMIILLNFKWFKKNKITLFIGGFIVGSIVEYVISLIGESIFNVKWWDYTNMPYNINGRICLMFSFLWGILGIVLIKIINPKVDKIINKVLKKYFRIVTITGAIIIVIDCVVTAIALKMFFIRLVNNPNLDVQIYRARESMVVNNGPFYDSEFAKYLEENFFTDEVMLKAFPNIKTKDVNGNMIWIKDLFPEIQPYYYRIFTPKK